MLNLSTQQIQKYEKGKNRISAVTLQRFSDIFDVTPNFFFELDKTKLTKKLFALEDKNALKAAEIWASLPTKKNRAMILNIMNTIIENYVGTRN